MNKEAVKDFLGLFIPLVLLGWGLLWMINNVWAPLPKNPPDTEPVIAAPWREQPLPVYLDTVYSAADTNADFFWYYQQNGNIVRDTLVEYWNEK